MLVNINPETGIRYGVASLSKLADWVWDEFFYDGRSLTRDAIEQDYRDENGLSGDADLPDDFWDCIEVEEEEFELEKDGMKLGLSYLGGAALVWVFESPHTTECRECSPCVPNAGDLDSPDEHGFTAYTLPKDWFLG